MEDLKKIEKLLDKSKEVFKDCLLENGCLIAAPEHMPYYPKRAANYGYCWPGRDLGFNATGALLLGIDCFKQLTDWVWNRAEGFQKPIKPNPPGLLYRNYHPNGRIYLTALQADQVGTLLWALGEDGKSHTLTKTMEKIVKLSTSALIEIWDNEHFGVTIEDLWEERSTHYTNKTNFAYTLAATSKGLEASTRIFKNQKAKKAASQMKKIILKNGYNTKAKHFACRFEEKSANTRDAVSLDSSILGLVWPYEIVDPKSEGFKNTLIELEEILTDKYGVYRYQYDLYQGEMEENEYLKQGAGAWPLLTFWLAIAFEKSGNHFKARKYYWDTIKHIGKENLIPEQIFPKDEKKIGVKPLLWSHMMFVHATNELGYLKKPLPKK